MIVSSLNNKYWKSNQIATWNHLINIRYLSFVNVDSLSCNSNMKMDSVISVRNNWKRHPLLQKGFLVKSIKMMRKVKFLLKGCRLNQVRNQTSYVYILKLSNVKCVQWSQIKLLIVQNVKHSIVEIVSSGIKIKSSQRYLITKYHALSVWMI